MQRNFQDTLQKLHILTIFVQSIALTLILHDEKLNIYIYKIIHYTHVGRGNARTTFTSTSIFIYILIYKRV